MDADAHAKVNADLAAAAGIWNRFNQPEVKDNGISAEINERPGAKLDRAIAAGRDEEAALHDYEADRSELDASIDRIHSNLRAQRRPR